MSNQFDTEDEPSSSFLMPLRCVAVLIGAIIFDIWFSHLPGVSLFLHKLVAGCCALIATLCFFVACYGFTVWARDRYWPHLKPHALGETRGRLANIQPARNAHALLLPTTLEVGWGLWLHLWLSGFWLLILFILFINIANAEAYGFTSYNITGFMVSFIFMFALVFFHWWFNAMRMSVTITPDGIKYSKGDKILAWNTIRFFSVQGRDTAWSPLYYELSSKHQSVRWIAFSSSSKKLVRMYRPLIPLTAYQQKTDVLLQVVAAKTHLSLHDLRRS